MRERECSDGTEENRREESSVRGVGAWRGGRERNAGVQRKQAETTARLGPLEREEVGHV